MNVIARNSRRGGRASIAIEVGNKQKQAKVNESKQALARVNAGPAAAALGGVEITLSLAERNTKTIVSIILELIDQGKTEFRTGDVNALLREKNSPMGTWEVRAMFSQLERAGQIACDGDTGLWQATEALRDGA